MPDKANNRPTVSEFADVAHTRLARALSAYRTLSDRWDTSTPIPLLSAADVGLDAAIAVEAAVKAVVDQLGIHRSNRLSPELLEELFRHPTAPEQLSRDAIQIIASLSVLRGARHQYAHGALPKNPAREILRAVHDGIRVVLLLATAYDFLGSRWDDPAEALWEFDGQPAYFARQVVSAFSERRFEGLRLRCTVTRAIGVSHLRLSGAISASCEVEQSRWGGDQGTGALLDFPGIQAEVSVIRLPRTEEPMTAEGRLEHGGRLVLLAKDVNAQVDAIGDWEGPLSAPVYLRVGDETAWMVGPGDLRIHTLKLSIPFKAHSEWFVTPDHRQEVITTFLPHAEFGSASATIRFHHAGHSGQPAYRGEAILEGAVAPVQFGRHIAEWRHVHVDPTTQRLDSWEWGGVTSLHLICDIEASITFGAVDVFAS